MLQLNLSERFGIPPQTPSAGSPQPSPLGGAELLISVQWLKSIECLAGSLGQSMVIRIFDHFWFRKNVTEDWTWIQYASLTPKNH